MLISGQGSRAGVPYQLEGQLTRKSYRNGVAFASETRLFSVTVSNCLWRIVVSLEGGKHREDLLCDGADIFKLMTWDTNSMPPWPQKDRSGNPVLTGPANVANLVITPGLVPVDPPGIVLPLWLGLASQCYLEGARDSKLRQVWEYDDASLVEDADYTHRADWKRDDQGLGLPTSVIYYCDGSYRTVRGSKPVTIRFGSPYEKGFTQAIYEVVGQTETNGIRYPSAFRFTRYWPLDAGTTTNDLEVLSTVEGSVTNAVLNPSGVEFEVPAIPGTYVVDGRISAIPGANLPASYLSRDGTLKTLGEYKQTRNYASQVLSAPTAASDARARQKLLTRAFLLMSVVCVITAGAVLLARRRRETIITDKANRTSKRN